MIKLSLYSKTCYQTISSFYYVCAYFLLLISYVPPFLTCNYKNDEYTMNSVLFTLKTNIN